MSFPLSLRSLRRSTQTLIKTRTVLLHSSFTIALRAKCLPRERSNVFHGITLDIAKMFSLMRKNIELLAKPVLQPYICVGDKRRIDACAPADGTFVTCC